MKFTKKKKGTIGFPADSKKCGTFIKQGFKGWHVCFSIEQQTFSIQESETKKQAKWVEKMLRIALSKLEFKESKSNESKRKRVQSKRA